MVVHVAIDGKVWGRVELKDRIRAEAAAVLKRVRDTLGIRRVVMLSGDSSGDAQRVAARLGIDECFVCLPHEKVQRVAALQKEGEKVVMIGDGVNDAPALATADVGVSLGVSDLASDGANVVFLKNSLHQLPHLLVLGQRVLAVARVGVSGGMSVSLCQMVLAAFGTVPPLVNACLQEVVDLSAILNSLRVLNTRLE